MPKVVVVELWVVFTIRLGALEDSSNMSLTPDRSSIVLSKAVTATGTSCRFCSRFWAVTITSSSCALALMLIIATVAMLTAKASGFFLQVGFAVITAPRL